ncbi:MAG TPA: M14 family metallopeptidase [Thermoanaerobaculia bacterium]|nr:M14 family metallopeptidase [Thermoanaerobaculia bacterium]
MRSEASDRSRRPLRCIAPFVVSAICSLSWSAQPAVVPEPFRTVAERSDFRATSSYEETMAFLGRLAAESPAIHVTTFGTSGEGRPLPLVVVSAERAFTPEAAKALAAERGKPVVLVQNVIHGGEVDGKDASLMLLRDLALGRRPELLAAATLLVVPIYNVDGHERVSPFNRPNQNGPVEGMGFRTNAAGLDLNRDHLKLDSPEARAVVALFDRWRPHLHVDDHVTDGTDLDWVLTWSVAEAPQLHPGVAAWTERHLTAALAVTRAAGHPAGPYVDLVDGADPTAGFTSAILPPRFATGYYPLRHRPSILVEMHSPKPYRDRVLANRDFLAALLAEVAADGRELVKAVTWAEAETVALGRPDAPPSEVAVRWETAAEPDRLEVPFHDWYLEESIALGTPILRYRESLRPVEVPWHHRPAAAQTVARPRGYLLLPGWPEAEERLLAHGLRVERLAAAATLRVETLRVDAPDFAAAPYQGRTRVSGEVRRVAESVEVPAGTSWVPADQPHFAVAVQLFEPEADDSLFSWGVFSSAFERKEYIDPRNLEPLVRRLLAEDPALAAEWEAALQDEAFAADPNARWLWWYRRTPYWDDTVGRLPVFRALEVPGEAALSGMASREPS